MVGGVMTPLGLGSWNMNQPPPGLRFMTVATVPSEMRGPVGFAGAGTSPAFSSGAAWAMALARLASTTRAGGYRQPGVATTSIQNT